MATLVLADGTRITGEGFGAKVDSDGEVVFNTGMVGYPESLTDPSYRGQILVFTYPLIGNYGVPTEEKNEYGFSKNFESEAIHVRGVIVAQVSETHSHHAAVGSFSDWLTKHGIPGITGVDTRMLTKKLREHGVMLGGIRQETNPSTTLRAGETEAVQALRAFRPEREINEPEEQLSFQDPNLLNLVAEVSIPEPIVYEPKDGSAVKTVIAYDCGMKRNILRSFLKRGVRVVRVPWDFDLASYDGKFDGVFISNGPGDPKTCVPTIKAIQNAIEQGIPTFGICLGNQLMALAVGGDTYKLKYGHRGANQPCVEVGDDGKDMHRCIITSQNHGFAVDGEKLPKDWRVWWRNANDGTVEGLRHKSGKFYAVQFHPEATPGPEDANYLFDTFLETLRQ
ncbi:MAG: glutamine-hydrolyzing carbamoyl-phosphate synthase small subunit [Candidatus Peregrinibacteria bacterium]|nr:glutamine-hydrolyzing carbamoyl-phosphate synthase small subunit [Candidatus Peregrinibacteria bacterium]